MQAEVGASGEANLMLVGVESRLNWSQCRPTGSFMGMDVIGNSSRGILKLFVHWSFS